MDGMNASAIEDLLAAGCAWGRNNARRDAIGISHCFANRWEQHHLADSERSLIVLLLIPERARHTTAAARNDMHRGTAQQPEYGSSLLHSHESFLVAVAVQPYLHLVGREHF